MQFFRLVDDMYVPNRWHLGDITGDGAGRKIALDRGRLLQVDSLDIEVTQDGRPLDFSFTAFNVPVAIEGLAMEMELLAGLDFQRIPARILNASGFDVLNCTRRIRCLDESKSDYIKWHADDHRGDLVGQYRSVTTLIVDPNLIPAQTHMFRVWGWVAFIVSEKLKDAMEESGCFGAKFLPVSSL